MTDICIEELIAKKKSGKDYALTALYVTAGAVVSVVLLLLGLIFSQYVMPFVPILIAAAWYGVYWLLTSRNIEYEYSVINHYLDIDKITSKKKRKRLVSIDIKNVSLMANVKDDTANDVYKTLPPNAKILDCGGNSENLDTYFIDCVIDSQRTIVLFQPSSRIVDALWKFNPKAVKKYNI